MLNEKQTLLLACCTAADEANSDWLLALLFCCKRACTAAWTAAAVAWLGEIDDDDELDEVDEADESDEGDEGEPIFDLLPLELFVLIRLLVSDPFTKFASYSCSFIDDILFFFVNNKKEINLI